LDEIEQDLPKGLRLFADKVYQKGNQPIESLLSWIEEKTNIQIAGKVRSYEGLLVHIFGKIAAALLMLQQRFCS
jgi:uncharacterized protein (UPF0128 family)